MFFKVDAFSEMSTCANIVRRASRMVPLSIMVVIAACGSGSSGGSGSQPGGQPNGPNIGSGSIPDSGQFAGRCVTPRVGPDANGDVFQDQQGTAADEKQFLRSWSDELYLWYDEIIDVNPEPLTVSEYFDKLKTFELTPTGKPKDNFHFSANTEDYNRRVQGGATSGYGVAWAFKDGFLFVRFVEPDSPAEKAGLQRGDKVTGMDDITFPIPSGADAIRDRANRILSPSKANESHEFTVVKRVSGMEERITLVSADVISVPVQNTKAVETNAGRVGYLTFHSHNEPSELGLINAVRQLQADNVSELVIDMRYNGGGFLYIASQLAYMVAGSQATSGKTFGVTRFNDKFTEIDFFGNAIRPTPFIDGSRVINDSLPSLDLKRVFVLSSRNTCSASEAFINGLRGIDIDVVLIGDSTCGKPYGFFPKDNCSTTWFSVQLQTVNAKNFGDYPDGFTPANAAKPSGVSVNGCEVLGDDLNHDLGSVDEEKFATALRYIETGACAAVNSISGYAKPESITPDYELIGVPEWEKNLIIKDPQQ